MSFTVWIFTDDPAYLKIVEMQSEKGVRLKQPIPFTFEKKDEIYEKLINSHHTTVDRTVVN